MTLTLLHNEMFDVGDLPVLTFGNCVLKTRVITWPLNLYVRFVVFFSKSKNVTVFLSVARVFSTLDRSDRTRLLQCTWLLDVNIP